MVGSSAVFALEFVAAALCDWRTFRSGESLTARRFCEFVQSGLVLLSQLFVE
jgi:hypothetical protein